MRFCEPSSNLTGKNPSRKPRLAITIIAIIHFTMPPRDLIQLPGNTLEGGGQLVRISIGLSSLLSLPIHIPRIRAGRPAGGGLKAQHLTCVNWLSKARDARTVGAEKKSQELEFWPSIKDTNHREVFWTKEARKRIIDINIGTPGSMTLTVQAVLPYIIFAASEAEAESVNVKNNAPGTIELRIIGGTNVSHSPSVEYLDQVMFPILSAHVLPRELPPLRMEVSKRCWAIGPNNSLGKATFWIPAMPFGSAIPAFEMKDRGEITKICASIIVPEVEISKFKKALIDEDIGTELEIIIEEDSGHLKRFYLLLVAHTSNGYRLGRDLLYNRFDHKKMAPESETATYMVETCLKALKKEIEHGGCVDEFMQDELVVFQALASGRSFVYAGRGVEEGSLHTQTARWVAETLTGIVFNSEGKFGVEGVGLKAGSLEWENKS